MDSSLFDTVFGNLPLKKLYVDLTTADTEIINRLGDTIQIPTTYTSTFVLNWDDLLGLSLSEAIDSLRTFWPAILQVQKDYVYQPFGLPNDTKLVNGDPKSLVNTVNPNSSINMEDAWEVEIGKNNVLVGVLDSGIDWDHEDFSTDGSKDKDHTRVIGGKDWLKLGSDPYNETTWDSDGHGTACAGVIGAIRNNGKGIAGIAGGNDSSSLGFGLVGMKIYNSEGLVFTSMAVPALLSAVREQTSGNNGFGCHVVNLSWGGYDESDDDERLREAMRMTYKSNVLVAAASGNDGVLKASWPSSWVDHWCMRTGWSNDDGERHTDSDFGFFIDVIAPGQKEIVTSTIHNNSYHDFGASSAAAPHVAGVAALMISYINNNNDAPNSLSPDGIEELIEQYATDVGSANWDEQTGNGRLNAKATLEGIKLPRFRVEHQALKVSTSDATIVGTVTNLNVIDGAGIVNRGIYTADKYKIEKTYQVNFSGFREVNRIWVRNSSSNLLSSSNNVFARDGGVTFTFNETNSTIKLTGFIYHIKFVTGGTTQLNKWLPMDLNSEETMAFTIYSDDPLAMGINYLDSLSYNLVCYPNPAKQQINLDFNLPFQTSYNILINDISGRTVLSYQQPLKSIGLQYVRFNLNSLSTGIYYIRLEGDQYVQTKKIIIN